MRLQVVERDAFDPYEENRPVILVSRSTLKERGWDEGELVDIIQDDQRVTCFVAPALQIDLGVSECATSRLIDRHLGTEFESVEIEPGRLRDAETMKLTALISGGITMSGEPVPREKRREMDEELLEMAKEPGQRVYVGKRWEVRSPAGDGTHTASRVVQKLDPKLVARTTEESTVVPS